MYVCVCGELSKLFLIVETCHIETCHCLSEGYGKKDETGKEEQENRERIGLHWTRVFTG